MDQAHRRPTLHLRPCTAVAAVAAAAAAAGGPLPSAVACTRPSTCPAARQGGYVQQPLRLLRLQLSVIIVTSEHEPAARATPPFVNAGSCSTAGPSATALPAPARPPHEVPVVIAVVRRLRHRVLLRHVAVAAAGAASRVSGPARSPPAPAAAAGGALPLGLTGGPAMGPEPGGAVHQDGRLVRVQAEPLDVLARNGRRVEAQARRRGRPRGRPSPPVASAAAPRRHPILVLLLLVLLRICLPHPCATRTRAGAPGLYSGSLEAACAGTAVTNAAWNGGHRRQGRQV